jgi:hypothetical protein
VETVAAIWREAVASFAADVTLVLNADDPLVASLGQLARGRVVLFGLDDHALAAGEIDHAADARWCIHARLLRAHRPLAMRFVRQRAAIAGRRRLARDG